MSFLSHIFKPGPEETPYLDLAQRLQPFFDFVMRVAAAVRPNTRWTILYVLSFAAVYMFHTPFRNNRHADDSYAKMVKVTQLWIFFVFLFFHVFPRIISDDEPLPALGTGARPDLVKANVTISPFTRIFFAVFFIAQPFFLLLHKLKRRLRMGITYGADIFSVIINAVIVGGLCALHYAYCDQVLPAPDAPASAVRALLAPVFLALHPPDVRAKPFRAVLYMCAFGTTIVVGDYLYKRMRGFDPCRGVLWGRLFDLQKLHGTEEQEAAAATKARDWRELVPPPRRVGRNRARSAAAADSGTRQTIYFDLPSELADHNVNGSGTEASDVPLNTSFSVERVSFAATPTELHDVESAVHPTNRPGMVPWWSMFVFLTALQVAAGSMLNFLSFDVRSIQQLTTPKVFKMTFSAKLDPTTCDVGPSAAARRKRTPDGDNTDASATATSEVGANSPASSSSDDDDDTDNDENLPVWFDWIGDVGDGFNPTYEMARLLAQPGLRLHRNPRDPRMIICEPATRATNVTNDKRMRGRSERSAATGRGAATVGSSASAAVYSTDLLDDGTADSRAARSAVADDSGSAGVARTDDMLPVSSSHSPRRRTISGGQTSLNATDLLTDGDGELLPRGSFTIIGGDLAYPNPTDETYRTRLFAPYANALASCLRLQRALHSKQRHLVQQDRRDPNVANIHMLDAGSIAKIALDGDPLRRSRGTVTEALHTVPMLFAIPGNHDWFDGLSTFRKFIIEKSWIGGWFLPQRTSFFVIALPANWFILCCDTGNERDVDTNQRNYFLSYIDENMDENSCVVLCAHEPGWIYDVMEQRDSPQQPEIDRIALVLGTRLRLRLSGDIHNYTRHTPVDPVSEAPTLVVSGGGGAFLHGARDDKVIAHGTPYVCSGAFPRSNTYLKIATRLWGFRVVNWKFDIIAGTICCGVIASLLPVPPRLLAHMDNIVDVPELLSYWVGMSFELFNALLSHGKVSFLAVVFYFLAFYSAGGDRPHASKLLRLAHASFWTLAVVAASCGALALLYCQLFYLQNNGLLQSTPTSWRSLAESQSRTAVDAVLNYTRDAIGNETAAAQALLGVQTYLYDSLPVRVFSVLTRCGDPFETVYYLSHRVASRGVGEFHSSASRPQMLAYYLHILLFYWTIVTPVVSFIIGCYLMVSLYAFDFHYDAGYSAFQLEDFKNFVRFRLDPRTRELTAYVIGVRRAPKVWGLDRRHVAEYHSEESRHLPPHLRRFPSRWAPPPAREGQRWPEVEVVERFHVRPHRTGDGDYKKRKRPHDD